MKTRFVPEKGQEISALVVEPNPPPRGHRVSLPIANALNLDGFPTGFKVFLQRAPSELAIGDLVKCTVVRLYKSEDNGTPTCAWVDFDSIEKPAERPKP